MASTHDPYLWLEEVEGEEPLNWAEQKNHKTKEQFCTTSRFEAQQEKILAILDSDERIPGFVAYGTDLYNFWQDKAHPRGIWRRTNLDEYKTKDPVWETILDLDALAKAEDEDWVWGGHSMLRPDHDRALIHLSRGGGDAAVVREFDLEKRGFLENGFTVPEAKSNVSWAGRDKLLIGTDFGSESMTDSGYPMTVCVWERGKQLSTVREIFRGESTDVGVGAHSDPWNGYSEYYITRGTDFYNSELFVYRDGNLERVNKPSSANAMIHRGALILRLKTDWNSYKAGSLLIGEVCANTADSTNLDILFEPDESSTLEGWSTTKDSVVLNVSENVRTRAYSAVKTDTGWRVDRIGSESGFLNESAHGFDSDTSDIYVVHSESFLEPPSVSIGQSGSTLETLKQAPSFFNESKFAASQHWATSQDGTCIPYYEIRPASADGPTPTLLYGYGGFEVSMLPQYSGTVGVGWLERGGSYVIANIRGGGEFGPAWHHAALRERRHKAYDDFIAVAEDLINRGVVRQNQLGIQGGSNGGLLMGNMYTRRPDLFGAIACQVPLLDMSRYHLLLAGASWMAEYGDPENPDDWEFLKNYSPYQNVDRDGNYPPILITTSTRDDRVHPGHARKMAARLEEFGHTVYYYENTAGGHAGAADNTQRAFMQTLVFEFLWDTLSNA